MAGCHHSRLVFNGCANFVRPRAASSASAGSLFPRFWLHSLCAKRQFLRSYGSPPRLTGSISSTSGDAGEPCFSFTSTNPPQSQQFVSSLSTCALSLFRFVPLALLGSLMLRVLLGIVRTLQLSCCSCVCCMSGSRVQRCPTCGCLHGRWGGGARWMPGWG